MQQSDRRKPKPSLSMDSYGEAVRSLISARVAATDAAFFLPYLEAGMKLLDCGCGEGSITVGLAEILDSGSVIGVDVAPSALEKAMQLANKLELTNVRFQEAGIYDLPFPDESFDAVFAHAIFQHLSDWDNAIGEIRRVIKPGGLVGLRSPDWGSIIIEPLGPELKQFWQLMCQIRDELGGKSNAGRQLSALLHKSGFIDIKATATIIAHGTQESRNWLANMWSNFSLDGPYSKEWLERNWVEEGTLERFSDAWKAWAALPGAFAARPWCEAVGWKA